MRAGRCSGNGSDFFRARLRHVCNRNYNYVNARRKDIRSSIWSDLVVSIVM